MIPSFRTMRSAEPIPAFAGMTRGFLWTPAKGPLPQVRGSPHQATHSKSGFFALRMVIGNAFSSTLLPFIPRSVLLGFLNAGSIAIPLLGISQRFCG